MTTSEQPQWAHEDPKALAYLRKLGTATSMADRRAIRQELNEYLIGEGGHLEMDLKAFGAAHLARVDREAWSVDFPDAARTQPQWKLDQRLHGDYRRYAELVDHAAHGENEVDRGQFARQAAELREYWQMTAPADWQQLRELQQQWETDPATARASTQAEWQHNPEPNRHLSFAQRTFDPQAREYEQWQQMHNQVADLNAELAAARSPEEADQIDARIRALYEEGRANWPSSWHEFEDDASTDPEWHRSQSERSGERYAEILAERENPRPVNAFAAAQIEHDGLDR